MSPSSTPTKLRIGEWCVQPTEGLISRDGSSTRVEVRTMRLLVYLAERAGQVVSMDELLDRVWSDVIVSQDSVYQAVTSLRRLLGDDPKQSRYIATVPRFGYRMVATVGPWIDLPNEVVLVSEPEKNEAPPVSDVAVRQASASTAFASTTRPRVLLSIVLLITLCIGLAAALLLRANLGAGHRPSAAAASSSAPQKSIAVLPFLDLTQGMKEEEFADGMTEELIDKLSKIPDLRVPSPTASFYYKGKQAPVADIAQALGVAFVVDGSVRKSGAMLRVAARLVRADNGYVVWSETYDRPFTDRLMVQDEIAGKVAKALGATPEFKAP
jgi:transcriptional activator of cad operon